MLYESGGSLRRRARPRHDARGGVGAHAHAAVSRSASDAEVQHDHLIQKILFEPGALASAAPAPAPTLLQHLLCLVLLTLCFTASCLCFWLLCVALPACASAYRFTLNCSASLLSKQLLASLSHVHVRSDCDVGLSINERRVQITQCTHTPNA